MNRTCSSLVLLSGFSFQNIQYTNILCSFVNVKSLTMLRSDRIIVRSTNTWVNLLERSFQETFLVHDKDSHKQETIMNNRLLCLNNSAQHEWLYIMNNGMLCLNDSAQHEWLYIMNNGMLCLNDSAQHEWVCKDLSRLPY
mgnify:CR=1 FL=1